MACFHRVFLVSAYFTKCQNIDHTTCSSAHVFACRFECWRVLTPEAMPRRCRHRVVGTKAIAHSRSRPAMPVMPDAVASIAPQPAVRDDRDPPLVTGQGASLVRQIRISVKWNILRVGLDVRCDGNGRGCFARRAGEATVTASPKRPRDRSFGGQSGCRSARSSSRACDPLRKQRPRPDEFDPDQALLGWCQLAYNLKYCTEGAKTCGCPVVKQLSVH
jgi:hypothetical protein